MSEIKGVFRSVRYTGFLVRDRYIDEIFRLFFFSGYWYMNRWDIGSSGVHCVFVHGTNQTGIRAAAVANRNKIQNQEERLEKIVVISGKWSAHYFIHKDESIRQIIFSEGQQRASRWHHHFMFVPWR